MASCSWLISNSVVPLKKKTKQKKNYSIFTVQLQPDIRVHKQRLKFPKRAAEIGNHSYFCERPAVISSAGFTRGGCRPPSVRSDAQLLLQYDATQRRFGEMENLMKSIEQELNHVFHTIASENGAWDTGEPSGRVQSGGWNWKWTAAPSPFWQPGVNKSQFPSIASHSWPQKNPPPTPPTPIPQQCSGGSAQLILR